MLAFVQDKIEQCGLARWRSVFGGLFDFAVEKDSPELLAELLELSHGGSVAKFSLKPEPNHPALLKACGKNDYALTREWDLKLFSNECCTFLSAARIFVQYLKSLAWMNVKLKSENDLSSFRAFVDHKYRLALAPKGRKRGWKDSLKVVRFFMDPEEEEQQHVKEESSDGNYSGTRLQGSDHIRNLQLLELSVRPAYLLACYSSLAESHDWKKTSCECLPEEMILNSHSSFREGERS